MKMKMPRISFNKIFPKVSYTHSEGKNRSAVSESRINPSPI